MQQNKKQYIGLKIIFGTPINRGDYNIYRGWTIPEDENGDDTGFKVEDESGRESWIPTDDFEIAYKDVSSSNLSFGDAIFLMKKGHKVSRKGWNGKNMWIAVSFGSEVESSKFWNPHNARYAKENGGSAEVLDVITMKTADGKILMGWLASQTDILADDWGVVE